MARLVVIATAMDPMQAMLIKSQLEAHAIPVMLSKESAGTVYGLTIGTLGQVDILVAEGQAAEAKAILEDSNFEIQDSKDTDQPEE